MMPKKRKTIEMRIHEDLKSRSFLWLMAFMAKPVAKNMVDVIKNEIRAVCSL